jgi:hypothetical protein
MTRMRIALSSLFVVALLAVLVLTSGVFASSPHFISADAAFQGSGPTLIAAIIHRPATKRRSPARSVHRDSLTQARMAPSVQAWS